MNRLISKISESVTFHSDVRVTAFDVGHRGFFAAVLGSIFVGASTA